MKSSITLLFLFIYTFSNAQDIIFLKNGEEIKAKVKEVTQTEIKYLKFENQESPIYSLSKAQVLMVKYENGSKDIFEKADSFIESNPIPVSKSTESTNTAEMYEKGIQDATFYYNGKHSGKTGVLLASLLTNGLIGLIPAIPCSLTKPKIENLNIPNAELYRNNANYAHGYDKQAKKIKSKKIWTNYAIGTAISTFLLIVAKSSN